jgi:hypothetical protein
METNENVFLGKKLCEICGEKPSAYTCPRCNLTYCSSVCYKDESKHLECSESFYRDQVMSELKAISLNEDKELEKENKRKMLEILKKESEMRLENEEFGDENEEQNEAEEVSIGELSNTKEEKLIKAYEEQVRNWLPWWLNENIIKSSLIQENEKIESPFKFNENLFRIASTINTSKANELILVDICTFVYEFALIGHVYQMDESDYSKSSSTDFFFVCDIVNSFIELDKITRRNQEQEHSIKSQNDLFGAFFQSRFEFVLKELSESDECQLKKFVNKSFLFGLLDEMVKLTTNACKSYAILISKCYDLFEMALDIEKEDAKNRDSITNRIDSKIPINPFHHGHNREQSNKKQFSSEAQISRKTKIQILTPHSSDKKPDITKRILNSENKTQLSNKTKHELKLFLKRLEFYFKWIHDNTHRLNEQLKLRIIELLKQLKEEKEASLRQFQTEHEFIQRNLPKLRSFANQSKRSDELIKEIKNED